VATTFFPDLTRPDGGTLVIGSRHAGDAGRQRRLVEADTAALDAMPWPAGLAAVGWFASTDGQTLLTYAQWADGEAADAGARDGRLPAPLATAPRYRLHRSLAREDETRAPGCLITAAFDADGPERQRHLIDRLVAVQPVEGGHPGAISAHFLLSEDGTRVLLHTEWTDIEAHREAAEAGDHDAGHEIMSGTPGVRLTHGGRYLPHHGLIRPTA
jgi:heme-degrading monooxygenase HmoA